MLISKSLSVTHEGKPATLVVLRNDGFCWGRLQAASGDLDVLPDFDLYDETDDTALDILARIVATGEGGFIKAGFFD
jgi:hypothetical protein